MAVDVLIDADPLVYSCGFVGEEREYVVRPKKGSGVKRFPSAAEAKEWLAGRGLTEDDVTIQKNRRAKPFGHCRQALRMALEGIREHVDEYLGDMGLDYGEEYLVLSGGRNFRLDVATIRGYKANRAVDSKPLHYRALRTHILDGHGARLTDGIEADDWVAMRQWADLERSLHTGDYGTIICSIDKDLDQVPGLHYNYNRKDAYCLDEHEARAFFWRQVLTGDSTDNIPGCKGIGPTKAGKLIVPTLNELEMFLVAQAVYAENMAAYPEHHAPHTDPVTSLAENAKLLYMLRHPNDEFKLPEVP